MITVQVLQIIILACQVNTSNGATYESLYNSQLKCQKKLIQYVQQKDKKQQNGDSLTECLLER